MKSFMWGIILLSLPALATLTVEDPENLNTDSGTFSRSTRQDSSSLNSPDTGTFDVSKNKKKVNPEAGDADTGTFKVKEKDIKTGPYDQKGNYRIERKQD